jgi:hypothetical protein
MAVLWHLKTLGPAKAEFVEIGCLKTSPTGRYNHYPVVKKPKGLNRSMPYTI